MLVTTRGRDPGSSGSSSGSSDPDELAPDTERSPPPVADPDLEPPADTRPPLRRKLSSSRFIRPPPPASVDDELPEDEGDA